MYKLHLLLQKNPCKKVTMVNFSEVTFLLLKKSIELQLL